LYNVDVCVHIYMVVVVCILFSLVVSVVYYRLQLLREL